MIADRQTLKDLEISKVQDEGLSLFSLLDRTVTPGGRVCLEKRFRNPPAGLEQVSDVLDCTGFLLKNRKGLKLPFSGSSM